MTGAFKKNRLESAAMASPTKSAPSRRASRHADAGPVFVDASGKKLRLMRLVGGVALALVAGYLAVVGIALLSGGPNAAAPFLPAAAPAHAPSHPAGSPSETGPATGSETPLPAATGSPITVARYVAPAQDPAAQQAAPAGTAAPAPAPAPAPTAAVPAPTATPAPGQVQGNPTAPGQLRRPTSQPTHP